MNPALASILSAKVVQRGAEYFPADQRALGKITLIKTIDKDDGGTGFAIEFEIVACQDLLDGSSYCLYRDVPGKKGMGAADIRTWLGAIVDGAADEQGVPRPEFSGAVMQAALDGAFTGSHILVTSTGKPTQTGGVFTRYSVEYVPSSQVPA